MLVLGISAFYHDSAVALIDDGEIIAAAQEERFSRIKHDASFPNLALDEVLKFQKLTFSDIDYVVFYDKPLLKFERILETYLSDFPKGFKSFSMSIPIWLREKLFLKNFLLKELKKRNKEFRSNQILFSEHHMSHAASAFYPSPFNDAMILTLDGVGEWATGTIAIGKGNNLEIIKEMHFPHSLGLLYSAFTYFIGFRVNSGEYKVMGLAPYGKPIYEDLIFENLIDLKEDGSFKLNQKYFNYSSGLTMTNNKFSKLFGKSVRKPDTEDLEQFHMDMAASIQSVTEKIILKITKNISQEYKINNLCMAGGVALNCVANGKILRSGDFENIWIQPAAGDAGGAIGAALAFWFKERKNLRKNNLNDSMNGSYLGPSYSDKDIEEELKKYGANYKKYTFDEVINNTAEYISKNKAIGWFQGRMEFGPRALGNRSILGNATSPETQKTLNLKVKYRESFRPFAPSVIEEECSEWFELNSSSPYMLLVDEVKKENQIHAISKNENLFGIDQLNLARSNIPAVTHIDMSARIQTVSSKTNPLYHKLLSAIKSKTGCPVVVNTSFNVRGEPIVASPKDAFMCFMGTELDYLVIGNFILDKKLQNPDLKEDYKNKYKLD
jgi:carbamoyltransferase